MILRHSLNIFFALCLWFINDFFISFNRWCSSRKDEISGWCRILHRGKTCRGKQGIRINNKGFFFFRRPWRKAVIGMNARLMRGAFLRKHKLWNTAVRFPGEGRYASETDFVVDKSYRKNWLRQQKKICSEKPRSHWDFFLRSKSYC